MTVKQVQLMLMLLGWEELAADGVWGVASREACVAFQRQQGLDPDGIPGEKTQAALVSAVAAKFSGEADWWQGIRFFRRQEFACPCPRCGGFPAEPQRLLVETADKVRMAFGKPALVSSGVRCREHNREVGGVENSRHLLGKAVDFTIPGVSAGELLEYAGQLKQVRYCYAIDEHYIHMDIE